MREVCYEISSGTSTLYLYSSQTLIILGKKNWAITMLPTFSTDLKLQPGRVPRKKKKVFANSKVYTNAASTYTYNNNMMYVCLCILYDRSYAQRVCTKTF